MEDRLPTRPLVLRAVRLLSQPRRSAADSGLVTAVALRLAALDSDGDTSDRLIEASDRVISGVSGLIGEQAPAADWSDTAEALAMEIAGRSLTRRHLVAARATLGSADKLIDLSERLRRTAEEPIDRDDLGRALALAVTGPSEMLDALIERERNAEAERHSGRLAEPDRHSLGVDTGSDRRSVLAVDGERDRRPRPEPPSRPAPGRATAERGVSLRALDGGLPGH